MGLACGARIGGWMVEGYTYRDSRELFAAVRDASRETQRHRRTLERMEAGEGVRGSGGFEPRVRSSAADVNGTARTLARVDYEASVERRIEEDWRLIDLGCALLYGRESGRGGVEALMGGVVADCIYFRFVAAESWAEVAAHVGYSKSQCRRFTEQGMDGIDFFGWRNLMGEPDGGAEG